MAKVEIENRAFSDPRLLQAAHLLETGKSEVIGYLVSIWHASQQQGLINAVSYELESWLECGSHAVRMRIVEVFTLVGFLEISNEGCEPGQESYRIDGNTHRIGKVQARIIQSKEAAFSRWHGKKLPAKKHADSNAVRNAISNAVRIPISNADSNADAMPDSITSATAKKPSPALPLGVHPNEPTGSQVWEAYRAAYFVAYGVEPVRNAKTNTICKQLVQRLGGDGAVSVVKFFLTHRQSYYVTKLHSLTACLADAESLHTQMRANYRVSASEARAQDNNQANAQTFAAVEAKLKKEGIL